MPSVAEIASVLKVAVRGDAQRQISAVASLTDAAATDISFIAVDSYLPQFRATRAGAVIVAKSVRLPAGNGPALLMVENVDAAMVLVLQMFAPPIPRPPAGVHASACIAQDAVIAPGAAIGPHVVVGSRSCIGSRSIIHPGVIIGEDVTIGEDTEIFPNVVIRERITIGNRVIIHAGSVLGTDGFGYHWDGTKHAKIPQIGTIVVEDDVELGSCVCVDRAKMGQTRIGRGTKVDNLIQIAHNCIVGPHCIIIGQAGLAGSVVLGSGVVIGGQVAVRDHVTIGDGAMVAGRSGIQHDVAAGTTVSGTPAMPHRQSLREQAAMRRLPDLVTQVRKLQDEVERLKKAASGT